jgi:hypothetical protein
MVAQQIQDSRNNVACRFTCLANKYSNLLKIGSDCIEQLLCDLVLAANLIDVTCFLYEDEECLTSDEMCKLFKHIDKILIKHQC